MRSRKLRPKSPRCVSLLRAMYWSRPPCFWIERSAEVATRVVTNVCSVSLHSVLGCTFGLQRRAVLWREFGIVLPNCRMRPSYNPRCARLNVRPACAAITSVGREACDERASVLPERPGPEPRAPRYVVRDQRTSEANMTVERKTKWARDGLANFFHLPQHIPCLPVDDAATSGA